MLEVLATKIAEVIGTVFLHSATQHMVTDRKALKTALSHSTVFRSRKLRVSIAQVLCLKVGDKFVLISNDRRRERFTPIGGVIRYFESEIPILEGKIGFKPEFKTGPERYDLRGYLNGKEFIPFLRWLGSAKGREHCTLAREIEEEFDEIGISGIRDHVRRPEFVKDRIVHEGPREVKNKDYWQYRYFEVLSLREESDVSKQLAGFIRSQVAAGNPKLVLASTDEIREGRVSKHQLLGDSCGYLFSDSNQGGIEALPLL